MTLYDSFSGIFLVWIPSVGGILELQTRGLMVFEYTALSTGFLVPVFSPKRGCLDVFHSRPHRMKQRGPARPHVEADQETP
ncbi:uncharacterized protein ARMOST_06513 [Armillaria ostoyae]|uniref:Uncharacterized protein n=1 Tax=Armillaria ostoyae TaxID=47428 RepID=A0A284R370_ARMOS|nr:uncharacterized protein ARMOST_06513 [Armillaria ostoyae]